MNYRDAITRLKALADAKTREGMKRYGIDNTHALGISVPKVQALAKEIGIDHLLAVRLWNSGIHEARWLAAMIDDPSLVTEEQMENWVADFDSWDVCDGVCSILFDKTPLAYRKAIEWTHREEEYVRRAGFVMMATLAVHDKKAADKDFAPFFPLIKTYATDERNFVKKAVNWALRQIGKRNSALNRKAIALALQIRKIDSKSARWIAADALRELNSEKVQARLRSRRSSQLGA